MVDLRQLEVFCRIVELESFTLAAKKVHLSQAAVSERIAALEESLGAQLIDRLGRRVQPTPTGRWLYERALALLSGAQELQLGLQRLLHVEGGELVVAASTIPGEHILPRMIAELRRRHPRASVSVPGGNSADVVRRVEAGEAELGVAGATEEGSRLRFEALWEDELALVVPAGHRLARKRRVTIAELAGEPFVLREQGSGTRRALEAALAASRRPVALEVAATLGSTAAVKEAVIARLGVSVLSRLALATELRAGLLHALPLAGLELRRRFHLVSDPRRASSPLAARFVELLRADRAPARASGRAKPRRR